MKGIKILLVIAAGCLIAGYLHADIYEWTDEDGVKHFTNYAPPEDATILMKTKEVPYDEAADQARMEEEKQFLDELARLERAAREAELERRVADAERRAAEAERSAQETLEATEQYLNDAGNRWYYRVGGYYPYYPAPYRHYYKRKYWKINKYNYAQKKDGQTYYRKKHDGPLKFQSPYSLRSGIRGTQGAYHTRAQRNGRLGRGYSARGGNGYRR